jgi:hypothetical protein
LCFISYGIIEQGDPNGSMPVEVHGRGAGRSGLSAALAGKKDLGTPGDYPLTDEMPKVNTPHRRRTPGGNTTAATPTSPIFRRVL